MPLLSVVVASIGRPQIQRAFASLEYQSAQVDYEVLVAGDEHDGPLPQLKQFVASMGPRYRYLATDAGLHCWGNLNRQAVLPEARGEWIIYLDDDDILSNQALESIVAAIRSQPTPRPLLFRFLTRWRQVLWDEPRLLPGRISGQCIVFPNVPERMGVWGADYEGDFQFIQQTVALWPEGPDWRECVICIANPGYAEDWTSTRPPVGIWASHAHGCLRCEAYGRGMTAQPSLSVFFHVAVLPQTPDVLAEQLHELRDSGLMRWAMRSFATVAGVQDDQDLSPYQQQLKEANFREIVEERHLTRWEFPTLRVLWEHCRGVSSSSHFALYLHTKGASKVGDGDREWRRELMDFAVRDWRTRLCELDGGRLTSGPRFVGWGAGEEGAFVDAYGHYSGNIWWAASDYVSWLPNPEIYNRDDSNRYAAEAWIGQHRGINKLRSEL
jgi:hypothetical protein